LAVYKSGSGKFDEFYGAKATLNVYGFPNLKGQESSSAVIWILNNADNQLNVITTGWHHGIKLSCPETTNWACSDMYYKPVKWAKELREIDIPPIDRHLVSKEIDIIKDGSHLESRTSKKSFLGKAQNNFEISTHLFSSSKQIEEMVFLLLRRAFFEASYIFQALKEMGPGFNCNNSRTITPKSHSTHQVYPELYGDTQTHFFTLWAVDEQSSTGCYNLQCNGFVLQNATSIVPGVVLNPVSTVDGPQYEVTIKVFKDATSGDWWLYFGHDDNLNPVGYWPKSLFTSLANKATRVDFGGQVTFPKNDTGPPMGSGHFPEDHKAAYFKDTNYIDKNGGFFLPDNPDFRVDSPDCYNLGGFDTDHFLYGGPGGCTN
ncbi:hypothetical protein ACMD2_24771, partial [Ananas comosus]